MAAAPDAQRAIQARRRRRATRALAWPKEAFVRLGSVRDGLAPALAHKNIDKWDVWPTPWPGHPFCDPERTKK